MSKSLAIKYRPTSWDDVTEQEVMKMILKFQIEKGTFRNAYLFTGPAGCGKTTCARIFAQEINHGAGNPLEVDAASNNSVDNVRELIQQAKLKSLDSEYKIFIIDECHALSNSAWQAMLKIIEEPPAKSIFIFCTTDPQKIPATIISRVQRYDFQRISQKGIVHRLKHILHDENIYVTAKDLEVVEPSIEYIAKLADGGMRDAITMLDKCLAFSTILTPENVIKALGIADYDSMFELTEDILQKNIQDSLIIIEELYSAGKDMKQFVKSYSQFITDVAKYGTGCSMEYVQIPNTDTYVRLLAKLVKTDFDMIIRTLSTFVKLNSQLKYSVSPKYEIESAIVLLCCGKEME